MSIDITHECDNCLEEANQCFCQEHWDEGIDRAFDKGKEEGFEQGYKEGFEQGEQSNPNK